MPELLPYASALFALGTLGVLLLLQVVIADVVGIRARHVPGTPPPADHESGLFRASRVVANGNETLGLFIVAFLFCLLRGVEPSTLAVVTWIYVGTRALFALCYYADVRVARSIVFGASLLTLAALLILGFIV